MAIVGAREGIHPAVLSFLDSQPKRMLIDGKWVEAASGKTFETVNPATGEGVHRALPDTISEDGWLPTLEPQLRRP